jgi:hypothetical protein
MNDMENIKSYWAEISKLTAERDALLAKSEQPLKREPLSKEEYMSLFIYTYHSENPITDFVRLIEKAHGIGVDDE